MILKPTTTEKLKELSTMVHGTALRELIEATYEELSDVTTIETIEELKGRQFAIKVLDNVFAAVGGFKPPTKRTRYSRQME